MNNLKVGSKGNSVTDLQNFLKSVGLYSGKIDGSYGPITQKAVQQFQGAQGIKSDGIVGPITQGKIQAYTVMNHPAVAAAMKSDPSYAATMNKIFNDPKLADAAGAAYSMLDSGTFTPEEFGNQFKDQYSALDKYYQEEQGASTKDIQGNLDLDKNNYARDTGADESQFRNDKNTLDTNAANNGVLFSTSRAQNETGLQNKYNSLEQEKADAYKNTQGQILNDYEYKYGTPAVNSLSQYMSAPGVTKFNASTPQNNTTPGGLASIYSPGGYYGTQKTAQVYNAANNTNSYLQNLLNKSNVAGYNTKTTL